MTNRKAKPRPRKGSHGRRGKSGLNWLRVLAEIGLILALTLLLIVTLAVGGITYMLGFRILPKINTVSFDELTNRISTYQKYFDTLADRGAEVIYAPPYQVEGVRYFSWTVREPGKQKAVIYNWKYELETEKFTALTEAAYQLDKKLGFKSEPGFEEGKEKEKLKTADNQSE